MSKSEIQSAKGHELLQQLEGALNQQGDTFVSFVKEIAPRYNTTVVPRYKLGDAVIAEHEKFVTDSGGRRKDYVYFEVYNPPCTKEMPYLNAIHKSGSDLLCIFNKNEHDVWAGPEPRMF